jgi:UDP-N-acetylglucosamine 2-epimerase (non-hydrolysing)/GDP/UDP-N,N'-diacetylbacillosamine 2-epimerase (hydrolysing)
MKRRICIITGTRAEYGLLFPAMKAIQNSSKLDLSVIVTGMHLLPEFGFTVKEIEADGFTIDAKVPMFQQSDTVKTMAQSVGRGIIGITDALEKIAPDLLVVIADRVEALAGAISGAFMNIPVAHIHGGDATTGGCIDEPTRHAITRFAHLHLPATEMSAERIVKMGEEPWRVHVVGPLGIYAMTNNIFISKNALCKTLNLDAEKPIILVVQHPVTTQYEKAEEQMRQTMEALTLLEEQAVIIYPNSDAGGRKIIRVIEQYRDNPFFRIHENLAYLPFTSLMRIASVMVGNSSSAVVEAPFFGVPAVNIGIRQEGRERSDNIIDVPHEKEKIVKAIEKAMFDKNFRRKIQKSTNPFVNTENGGQKIAEILTSVKINSELLQKRLTF